MPGKAGDVVAGLVAAKIVHQQERIEIGSVAEAEGAPQPDAGALQGGLRLADALDGADGHGGEPSRKEAVSGGEGAKGPERGLAIPQSCQRIRAHRRTGTRELSPRRRLPNFFKPFPNISKEIPRKFLGFPKFSKFFPWRFRLISKGCRRNPRFCVFSCSLPGLTACPRAIGSFRYFSSQYSAISDFLEENAARRRFAQRGGATPAAPAWRRVA